MHSVKPASKYPMHRKAGLRQVRMRVSWGLRDGPAIATRLMKGRFADKNFPSPRNRGMAWTVNRWLSTGFFGGSSLSNEAGVPPPTSSVRATGDTGLRGPGTNMTTGPTGGQSWPHIRTRARMTNSWNDIKNTDLVLIMGGNAPPKLTPCRLSSG